MAKKPTAKADVKGSQPTFNESNTPRHKLMAMGQKVDTGAGSGKKTPA